MEREHTTRWGKGGLVIWGVAAFFLLAIGVVSAWAAPAKQTVWRMHYWLSPTDPETLMLKEACEDILEYTEGRLKIDVYPAYSLKLNPATQLSNIRDGLCESACMSTQQLEGQDASLAVTEAPGVWASKEHQAKAVDAMIPFKKKVYQEVWKSHYIATKMMTVQDNGIFANKPIKTINDLKGMKLRVPSRRQLQPFKSLGLIPMTSPATEVYMSMKTGVIDAVSSGARGLIYFKWGEVARYGLEVSLAEANAQDIVINLKAWNAIPKDVQEIVSMVFMALGAKQRVMATMPGMSHHWRRQSEAMGVKFADLAPAEVAKFNEAFSEEWFSDLAKATNRTKEAWEIVKPFTMVK